MEPLFERLGGRDGIGRIADRAVHNHVANPCIRTRFEHSSQTEAELINQAVEFFCSGLTGVDTYRGRPIADAHAGMNIDESEFVAVLDDILAALETEGVGEQERTEVLGMLYGMKPDIVHR